MLQDIPAVVGEFVPDTAQAQYIASLLQAALGGVLDDRLGGPGLLLQGSAGCGKTALLKALGTTLSSPSQGHSQHTHRHDSSFDTDSPYATESPCVGTDDPCMGMGVDCRYIDCAALTLEDRGRAEATFLALAQPPKPHPHTSQGHGRGQVGRWRRLVLLDNVDCLWSPTTSTSTSSGSTSTSFGSGSGSGSAAG
ncbi:hypothetical protein B484DRAFT_424280, partial [Ochromonadaceae sp. CCMP2298]